MSLPNALDYLITPDSEAEKIRIADNCHTDSVAPSRLERTTGIEPAFSAWEADVLPINYIRMI